MKERRQQVFSCSCSIMSGKSIEATLPQIPLVRGWCLTPRLFLPRVLPRMHLSASPTLSSQVVCSLFHELIFDSSEMCVLNTSGT